MRYKNCTHFAHIEFGEIMIYVVRTKNAYPSFIKIGFTKEDIKSRMKSIQTGCPFELELIKKIPGELQEERDLHQKLKEFKTVGEWFKDCEESMAILGITKAKVIKLKDKKERFYLSDNQKRINRLFSPREYFGHRKRCSYELMELCEMGSFKPREVMDFPLRNRVYMASKMTYDQACINHNFIGSAFKGVGIILTPKKGSRHNRRKELEDGYCAPIWTK